MEICELLQRIFEKLDLSWIDQKKEIRGSQIYSDILSIFPNLETVFQNGWQIDKAEFNRTLKHIFRVFKIYFLMEEGKLTHNTLSSKILNVIRNKVIDQNQELKQIFILILMYHDIGKLFDKNNHPNQSFLLINNENLLNWL